MDFQVNRSNNKILNPKGNVQKCKVDRTEKIKKSTEQLAECCHTPDSGTGIFRRKWWVKQDCTVCQTSHLYDNPYSSV